MSPRKQLKALKSISATLMYALEVFEDNCQCKQCSPCRAQKQIRRDIRATEDMIAVLEGRP